MVCDGLPGNAAASSRIQEYDQGAPSSRKAIASRDVIALPMTQGEKTMYEEAYQEDFYQRMRDSIRAWLDGKGANFKFAEYLLAAPDLFHLLCRLAIDEDVPPTEKAKLIAAIVYFVSPFDFMPEAVVGPFGYVDDVVVAAWVLNALLNNVDEETVKHHWAGDQDVLRLMREILKVADEMVGSGLWSRIKASFHWSK
jgi:uncharacterized membrane protein YkvA (DUF1232 family)